MGQIHCARCGILSTWDLSMANQQNGTALQYRDISAACCLPRHIEISLAQNAPNAEMH